MLLKRKIYITATVFLGLIILLTVFIISPFFLEIKRNSYKFPLKKQDLAVLEKELESLQKFKKIWPEISPDLENISHLFIDDPEVPIDFKNFWKEAASDSEIYLEMFPAHLPQTVDTYPWPSSAFKFTSVGSFSNLLSFLEKLQSSDYLIKIRDLNIARLTEAELRSPEFKQFSLGDTKATILIKVYTE